eukprot:935376-Pleurochrysis_carterae.AAC.2
MRDLCIISATSSSAAISSAVSGEPSPRMMAFFGSLRESFHPCIAAMTELKKTSLPRRGSVTKAGIGLETVR